MNGHTTDDTTSAAEIDSAQFVQFGFMMKATPAQEAGKRIIYVEASNESVDQQGEVVLSKALKESADFFKKFGVVDMDHMSMPSIAKAMNIQNPEEWRVGHPLDVTFKNGTTIVKAELYQGDGPLVKNANIVWDGLTKVNPPHRYYASVGGKVLAKESRFDPVSKQKVDVITKTYWNNLALSLTPVNPSLASASTAEFAKSLGGFVLTKTLTAGYGTDSAALSGGAALRTQSLAGAVSSYQDFRDKLAHAITEKHAGSNPGAGELVEYSADTFGLSHDEASEWVERFLRDLHSHLSKG
jgi:hypothetical protein